MSQKVFIPLTDELLYDHPELITAPLRPFNADQPCFHWMVVPATDGATNDANNGATNDPAPAASKISKSDRPVS